MLKLFVAQESLSYKILINKFLPGQSNAAVICPISREILR